MILCLNGQIQSHVDIIWIILQHKCYTLRQFLNFLCQLNIIVGKKENILKSNDFFCSFQTTNFMEIDNATQILNYWLFDATSCRNLTCQLNERGNKKEENIQ